jgi:hypothetical protein
MEGSSTVNYAMRFILPAICIVVFVLGMGIADVTAQDKSPAPGASTASSPESKPSETRKSEPVEVWEYSAYKARVWLSISPTLGLSQASKQLIERKIAECMEIEFGATMQCDVVETPDALFGSVLYHIDDLTIEQLLSRELVLMLAKSEAAKDAFMAMQPKPVADPAIEELRKNKKLTKQQEEELKAKADAEARAASLNSVRTLDSVIERIPKISMFPLQYAAMQRDIVPYLKDEKWNKMQTKLDAGEASAEALIENLRTGKTFAALVPKNEANRFKEVARSLPTRFPWQPEAMLRDKDKIFLAAVEQEGERIRIQVKELDAFVRRIGLMESTTVASVQEIPNTVAYLQRRCFTPMARIEDNDNKTAVIRVRASGLVASPESPVVIGPGDVLAPFIRRDDLNGNPTQLQNIAFTYIAVTEPIDSARFYGAIFAASRGSLVAAKNRRTKRVALKVQPHYPTTELKLGIRGQPNSAVPGAEVYLRTPGSDDLKMLGRTDWRGMIGVTNTELPTITYDQPTSSSVEMISRARATAIRLKSLKENQSEGGTEQAEDPAVAAAAADEAAIAAAAEAAKKRERAPTRTMQIKLPLYLYYIKNGETLLARLPMITGYRDQEKADLPDDRRRLQAEAFLKGLQGEVLDLVVRRKILDARIKNKIEEGKKDEAFALLDELKKVKNYEALSAQIQNILRRATSTEMGPVPGPVAERIDKMIDVTRVLMQQYLQTDIVRELEVKLLGGAAPSGSDQGQPAAAGSGTVSSTSANGELGETYSIQGHSIQLPKGFKAVPDTRLPAGITLVSFEGPKRNDETFPSLLVGIMEKDKVDPKLTQEQHMEARLAVIAKNHKDWQATGQPETTINGVKFSKKSWKGIGAGIEKEVRGISYVAIHNGQLIWLSVQDTAPNFDTIPLAEASLMTFK